jgi:hypothetical protein
MTDNPDIERHIHTGGLELGDSPQVIGNIRDLDIASPDQVHVARSFLAAPMLAPEDVGKPEGYVDKGSVVAFVAGVSTQNKADVLNSTLLAQLAADKKFDREAKVLDWYKFYGSVLEKVGWVVQGYNWSDYKSQKMSFTMDEAVLEIVAAAFTGEGAAVVAATLDALRKLPKQDGRLQLFNHSSTAAKEGNFQISACSEKDGSVAMNTAAFYFNSNKQVTDVLFFTFASSDVKLTKSLQGQTLNTEVYAKVRNDVLSKLGNNASTFVLNLDI